MPGASVVDDAVYSEPAPRQRPEGMHSQLTVALKRSLHSELSLLRIVAAVTGISYPFFVTISHHNALRLIEGALPWNRWLVGVLLVLGASALLLVVSALVHRRRFYFLVFWGVFLAFSVIITVHMIFRLSTGSSPLQELYLGDYAGVPAAALVAATPPGRGVAAALTLLSVATMFNSVLPPSSMFYLAVELGHSWLLMGPFLFMIARGRQVSHRLDAAAAASYRSAVATARSALLAELEHRFLSHVHDNVLADLRSVAAGTMPAEQLHHSTHLEMPDSRPIAVATVVDSLREMMRNTAPGTEFSISGEISPAAVLPTDAAAAIEDCVHETLVNSVRHAPGARRVLHIEWDGRLTVTAADEGPGFDPAQIPTDRAGVWVSILHRPRSIAGLHTELNSAPGAGTRVVVNWDGRRNRPLNTGVNPQHPVPSAQETLGISALFQPATAVLAFLVFLALGLLHDHSGAWGYFLLGLGLTAVALALFCRVEGVRLDLPATYGVSACTFTVVMMGQLSPVDSLTGWPYRWYLPVGILLCAYLALRSRAWFAWGTWAVIVAATAGAQLTGPEFWPDSAATVSHLINLAPLLVPASFIPLLLSALLRSLPLLEQSSREEFISVDRIAAGHSFLEERTRWLRRNLAVVIADGSPECAAIMEKRLRDAIRSPLLDVPAVTVAVWRARSRGAEVRLIDDRSP
ncbi:MAG TPA: hypothetical protein VFC72_04015, partial [Corynebacterium sp.]|nr:hypothetical protein [Corynebacterium sp.]